MASKLPQYSFRVDNETKRKWDAILDAINLRRSRKGYKKMSSNAFFRAVMLRYVESKEGREMYRLWEKELKPAPEPLEVDEGEGWDFSGNNTA